MIGKSTRSLNVQLLPILVCSLGMLFYCYNYFLRVSPSVMQNDLMNHLHITAYQFGNLAAFYYYAYTPLQIPIGMIYDRFGIRIVLFTACIIALVGLNIFITADDLFYASLGRFLIGFGTAFSYIGVLKIASLWFAPNRFATIAGLTTAFGMCSAIFSDMYLADFVQSVGYKNALYSALWVGIALSIIILLFMRNKPNSAQKIQIPALTFKELLQSFQSVMMNSQMWLIGLIGCLFYLPASVFLDLWGIPYLETVYKFSPSTAASVISMTFIGWIVAGPTIGALSDKIKRRRLPLQISAVLATILLGIVFYIPGLDKNILYVLFFLIGIFCGAHPLCFALAKENNPNSISGTSVAVTNTLIMAGGVVFQPIVGKLLDWHNVSIQLENGRALYTALDFQYALSVVPLGLLIAIALTFLLKETYCQSHEESELRKAEVIPDNVYPFRAVSK